MVAELDSIADRTRFALGAIAAIARLTLAECGRAIVLAPGRYVEGGEPKDDPSPGGPSMSTPTTGQLLRRHATPFAVALAALTVPLLANHAIRRVPELSAKGVPAGAIVEVVLLAIPHTLALTIPMAVFLAVSWVFTRLGADGVLRSAGRERQGVRRLVAPVLGAASVVAMLTLVSNAQVMPRANARLAAVLAGAPQQASDRTMTIGELRDAARRARTSAEVGGAARAAAYEVEIQKKFALAAACIFLALAGVATAIRFPHGGAKLVVGASALVFAGYYVLVVAGEGLADRQVISPVVAMWLSNALLLGGALLLAWRPGRPGSRRGPESLAVGG
jgi:lipopolysaccharide export LptBFGC system permease protein LptF